MADLVYQQVINDLNKRIMANEFVDKKLPDERSLSEQYQVSRSSIKRALNVLANKGLIFKKRGSGTFINPLYLKNQSSFKYEGTNLGITDSLNTEGAKPSIQLLDFRVIPASQELQQDLFLTADEFVYEIKRLRLLDDQPFMIESGYIPIKLVPQLNRQVVSGSIFNYVQKTLHAAVTKSFLSIAADASNTTDQELLHLQPNEPVSLMSGIFFLDDGTPFEVSNMRLHYQYMKYTTFVSTNS